MGFEQGGVRQGRVETEVLPVRCGTGGVNLEAWAERGQSAGGRWTECGRAVDGLWTACGARAGSSALCVCCVCAEISISVRTGEDSVGAHVEHSAVLEEIIIISISIIMSMRTGEDRVRVHVEHSAVLELLPEPELGGHVPPALALVLVEARALRRGRFERF